jgi:hypothetical protein
MPAEPAAGAIEQWFPNHKLLQSSEDYNEAMHLGRRNLIRDCALMHWMLTCRFARALML